MRISLVGASSQQRSLPFNAERTVNLYPVVDESGIDNAALYGTAGLSLFATAGAGAIRGMFYSTNGRCFIVSASSLYELFSDGSSIVRGSLLFSSGTVTIDENFTQLAICDGVNLYTLTYSSNAFAKVTDVDLPTSVGSVAFIDNYMVVNENNTGKFYLSDAGNATAWQALEFATAESSPDYLLRVINALGSLFLFGERTTEIWSNTGSSDFPFAQNSGIKIEVGVVAPYSVITADNAIYFIGRDKFGSGLAYRMNGTSPEVISTDPIAKIIQSAPNKQDIVSWVYQEENHKFVVFTGGGLPTSIVYDISTGVWHERVYLNDDGIWEQHLGKFSCFAFDKVLVGSRIDGKIYHMSLDYYSDDGREIPRQRIYTHLFDEGRRVRFNRLEVGFEVGVGNVIDPDSDPQCTLSVSKDGGRTYNVVDSKSLGKVGEYLTKVEFRRLGLSEKMTFKLDISAKVKIALNGSYIN